MKRETLAPQTNMAAVIGEVKLLGIVKSLKKL